MLWRLCLVAPLVLTISGCPLVYGPDTCWGLCPEASQTIDRAVFGESLCVSETRAKVGERISHGGKMYVVTGVYSRYNPLSIDRCSHNPTYPISVSVTADDAPRAKVHPAPFIAPDPQEGGRLACASE